MQEQVAAMNQLNDFLERRGLRANFLAQQVGITGTILNILKSLLSLNQMSQRINRRLPLQTIKRKKRTRLQCRKSQRPQRDLESQMIPRTRRNQGICRRIPLQKTHRRIVSLRLPRSHQEGTILTMMTLPLPHITSLQLSPQRQ